MELSDFDAKDRILKKSASRLREVSKEEAWKRAKEDLDRAKKKRKNHDVRTR